MDANTEITIDDLQDAIVLQLAEQYPDLSVDAYPDDRKALALPACLVELTDLEGVDSDDPMTGQVSALARFDIYVVLGFKTADVKREVRRLSAAIAAFVHKRRWGLPVGPTEFVSAGPDEFDVVSDVVGVRGQRPDQWEVWRIEIQLLVHFGQTVWTNEGVIPTEVLASYVPIIGIPHEDDYFPIAEAPDV